MRYQDRLNADALKAYASALNTRSGDKRVTPDHLRGVILECGGVCGWCGASLVNREFEIDHIVPLRRGGENTPQNLAVVCQSCNRRKGDKHPARFAQEIAAESAHRSPLVQRVLDFYGLTAAHQLSLFDRPPGAATPLSEETDPPEDVPPYNWARPDSP